MKTRDQLPIWGKFLCRKYVEKIYVQKYNLKFNYYDMVYDSEEKWLKSFHLI